MIFRYCWVAIQSTNTHNNEYFRIPYPYISHSELHIKNTYALKSSDTTIQVQNVVHV